MRRTVLETLIALLIVCAPAYPQGGGFPSFSGRTTTLVWTKCTVTNSGTDLVVTGTGCTGGTQAKAAALTQNVTLFQLPAKGYVIDYRIKTATAFTGTTTLLAGLGTASTPNFYLVSAVTGYDLKAAVSATNLTVASPVAVGSDTTAAVNIVLSLTSTVDNLSNISAGAVDIWVLRSVLP